MSGRIGDDAGRAEQGILILSRNVVAAALVGALVESVGFTVLFQVPSEGVDDALRRTRPVVAMVDCDDPSLVTQELIGRARMRGIPVLVFGSAAALESVRPLASAHGIERLCMPATARHLEEGLRRAMA